MFRPSVRLSVQNVLWLNGAFYSKSYYWQPMGSRIWEFDWYQNEWPWPLFRGRIKVIVSTIALYSTLNISETVRDRGLVPKDRQQEMAYMYGLSNGHVTNDGTWSQRCCKAVRSAILATAWLLVMVSDAGLLLLRSVVSSRLCLPTKHSRNFFVLWSLKVTWRRTIWKICPDKI